MALGDYVVLGGICVGAVLKMNNMKQVESWREKELLAKIAVHVVVERMPLTGWNESDLTFLRTSIADMNEAQHEYEDALATAVFDSTIQLLNELLCRMRTHRARIKSRLRAIAQMEHSLLIMLDETGHAKWAEMLLQNGVGCADSPILLDSKESACLCSICLVSPLVKRLSSFLSLERD